MKCYAKISIKSNLNGEKQTLKLVGTFQVPRFFYWIGEDGKSLDIGLYRSIEDAKMVILRRYEDHIWQLKHKWRF